MALRKLGQILKSAALDGRHCPPSGIYLMSDAHPLPNKVPLHRHLRPPLLAGPPVSDECCQATDNGTANDDG